MTRKLRHKDFLKPKEVAALLQVEPGTVRLWTQDGRLRATTTPGGHRRFSYQDVEQFAREHNIASPPFLTSPSLNWNLSASGPGPTAVTMPATRVRAA